MRHGIGAAKDAGGNIYKGQWFKNKKLGVGIEHYLDGSCYKGYYANGVKHGFGL